MSNDIYKKEHKIKKHRTGGNWNEELSASGKPIIENEIVTGGIIKMSVDHSGAGGASRTEHGPEQVTLEKWKAYVDKCEAIREAKEAELKREAEAAEKLKQAEEYKKSNPVNYFMDKFLKDGRP